MRTRRLAAALLLALAAAAGCDSPTPPEPAPSAGAAAPNGVDVLFAQMMVLHHAQAVTMSGTLLAKPDVPERAQHLARFITQDQRAEIDQMNAWLRAWGRTPVDPADPATARLHGTGTGHGMLTEAQLAEIARAAPPAATGLYLRHMIEHHRGAITMARSALDAGANAYIRDLARHIINEQSAENDAMGALLTEITTTG